MDIPLVSPFPLVGVGSATAVAPAQALTNDDAAIAAALAPSLTTVDLSPLGLFLSATSLFQKKMLELQILASNIVESQAQESSDIAASTTTLALAFNALQASGIEGTGVNADTLEQQSLAALFARQFGAQTVPAGESDASPLGGLASIGLIFSADDQLTVDLPALQRALDSDPVTTTALLTRAATAFGALVAAGVAAGDLVTDPQALAPAVLPETATDNRTVTAAAQENTSDSDLLASNQAASASVARPLAERDLADRAAALAANNRTQSANEDERADLADAIEAQDRLKAEQLKVEIKAEQQRRQQRNIAAQNVIADTAPVSASTTVAANAAPRSAPPAESPHVVEGGVVVPVNNNALQAARDPAIAAAIAAYSLNTGPFAALNARQELTATKIKAIPTVSSVAKVAAIETDTAAKGSAN
jgi:hypothetical protein